MAVAFMTTNAQALLRSFKKAIDDNVVRTWSYDNDGDFTHDTDQWRYKAWLRPVVEADRLTLNILKRNDEALTTTVYGIYHGRIIESMLTHFENSFTVASASARPMGGDNV